MRYKCKTCPQQIECFDKQKTMHLVYKPFENLKEILEKKYAKNNFTQ